MRAEFVSWTPDAAVVALPNLPLGSAFPDDVRAELTRCDFAYHTGGALTGIVGVLGVKGGTIRVLWVHPDVRSVGIGGYLLACARADYGRRSGPFKDLPAGGRLTVIVPKLNPNLLRFLEHNGFTRCDAAKR